ncbi:T9SS-dependent M36 family metallopeptidase [Hyunsoonleella sp. 2307UL5-6]|uniref:T9SS-dependent M36 family metallopeptidase n=1 Tax=Hyunsoonleella sp. 2307UL5-6 TaxID=3384768 RepID=UPI0039BC8214
MKNIQHYIFAALLSFAFLSSVSAQNKLTDTPLGLQVLNYIKNSDDLGYLSVDEIADIHIDKQSFSKNSGVTHVYLYQTYKGVKIHNAISNVALKDNKVFYFKDNFVSNIKSKINALAPALKPEQALQKTASHFNITLSESSKSIQTSKNKNVFSNRSMSQEKIPVELMYCKDDAGNLALVWDLNIFTPDSKHWWSVRIDAVTGTVLEQDDWVVNCSFEGEHIHVNETISSVLKQEHKGFNFETEAFFVDNSQYNVLPLPAESPNHGSFQVVTEPADNVASPFGWHDTDGVSGPEFTITRGNNVWAQDDLNANNGEGASPDGTSSLNFNFPLTTLEQPATNYIDVAATNLFYHNNVVHDIFYQYGFDEVSGNFQINNYGNGGNDDDAVFADVQDGADTNNANFATPPDGFNPRMQMFLWTRNQLPTDNLTVTGGSIAGTYVSANPSTGNGPNGLGNITGPSTTPVTGDLVVVDDGTAIPEEGCVALVNAVDVAGKIAVIRRGNCAFTEKIQNAQDAGAIGVIVANHNNPDNDPNYREYINMYGVTDPVITIPSLFINFEDGETIINAINAGENVSATIVENGSFPTDSSFDNGIIIHEYGHGISTRLTGGANNSGCLNNNFQMGEGWSDWFALMLTMKATDLPTDGRGIGTFVIGQNIDGLGIRTRQYSTDFSINEYTFAATNDDRILGQDEDGDDVILNQQVHYVGSLWATMLWDLTWAYVEKFGFDPDLYNGTGGNNRVLDLVVEGLKLQGCNPDFIDGRDGLLAADVALTGGENQCLIWDVFANRGLGVNASSGDRAVFTDQVEDFDTPDPSDISLANCSTLDAASFEDTIFKVFPNPANTSVTITMEGEMEPVTFNLVDINGRRVLSQTTTTPRRTTLNISALQAGIYILQIESSTVNMTRKLIKN